MAESTAQNGAAGEPAADRRIRIHRGPAPVDDGIKRTSNWWTAAAYNITAIIGLAVLGLPYAMVFLSWGGLVVMALTCFITYFTMKQLVELHEVDFGKRYMRYQDLGDRAFGAPWGQRIVLPMQMVFEFSMDVLFIIAVGGAMIRIVGHCHEGDQQEVHIFIWYIAFGAIQVALSCVLPDYSSIKWIAVVAAIMSICYSTIAWITLTFAQGRPNHVSYGPPQSLPASNLGADSKHVELHESDRVFQALNAIGVIAFAYAAHNVVLDIQNDLPSPSEKAMIKGVRFTYLVVALCYFPMAIAVYKVYGNDISSNALGFMVGKVSRGWVITTNIMLIIHLIGSYQIFAIPMFKILEIKTKYPPYTIRTIYIVSTILCAMVFPFFSPLLGFFGGMVIAPTTYILPCILWLRIKGNSTQWTKLTRAHYINWACVIVGIIIMIFAVVGGTANLIKQARIYNFYDIFTKTWKGSGFYPDRNCTKS